MGVRETTILENSVRRLFPNMGRDQVLAELLLERAQKNLIKYQAATRQYEDRYGQDFSVFRQTVLAPELDEETEQDYFDWELAVTGTADMQDEIKSLGELFTSQ